jgi:hypothetical protein
LKRGKGRKREEKKEGEATTITGHLKFDLEPSHVLVLEEAIL